MFNPAKKYEIHRNCGLVSTSSSTESFRDRRNCFQLGGKIIFSRKLVNHRLNVEYFGRITSVRLNKGGWEKKRAQIRPIVHFEVQRVRVESGIIFIGGCCSRQLKSVGQAIIINVK